MKDINICSKKLSTLLELLPKSKYIREISQTWLYIWKFQQFFQKQWLKYFKNQILNYSKLNKDERSNIYIESNKRIIKLKLSKYLYGKNHCRISWTLFMYFIKNEEEEYRFTYSNLEKETITKNILIEKKQKMNSNIDRNNKKKCLYQ